MTTQNPSDTPSLSRYEQAIAALATLGVKLSVLDDVEMVGCKGYYVYEPGAAFTGELLREEERLIMGQSVRHFAVKGRTNSFVAYGNKDDLPSAFEGEFMVSVRTSLENFGTIEQGAAIAAVCHGLKKNAAGTFSYFDADAMRLPKGMAFEYDGPMAKRGARIEAPTDRVAPNAAAGSGGSSLSTTEALQKAMSDEDASFAEHEKSIAKATVSDAPSSFDRARKNR